MVLEQPILVYFEKMKVDLSNNQSVCLYPTINV